MRWFRWPQPVESKDAPATGELVSQEHTSLAFNVLYHQFPKERKFHILDLGPASGANLEFFSQFSCRLYFEDLYATLSSFDYFSPEDGFSYAAVFDYLLPFAGKTRFDVIFSWDLFNYLEKEELRHLMRHLSRFCNRGTILFSLISTLKTIPEKPNRYQILDPQRLLYVVNSSVMLDCPRYQQSELDHLLPNFRVGNSFILRNGFKEYLFLYE